MSDPTKPRIELDGDISSFRRKMREAAGELNRLGSDGKKSIDSLGGAFDAVAMRAQNTLTGLLSLGAMAAFIKSTKDAVTQAEASFRGLESVANYAGVGIARAMEEAGKLAADGLMTTAEASKALQNLLSRGYSIQQSVDTLNRLKDAAAFNRAAHLSMGEAVVSATEGLKNENSILVDNAGVTKNVSKMWEEYAAKLGKAATQLTQAEKIQAEYNGVMQETEAQVGNAAKATEGLQGKSAKLASNMLNLKVQIGEALTPAFLTLSEWAMYAAEKFDFFVRLIQISGTQIWKWGVDIRAVFNAVTSWDFSNLQAQLQRNAELAAFMVAEVMAARAGSSFKPGPDSGKRKGGSEPPSNPDSGKRKGGSEPPSKGKKKKKDDTALVQAQGARDAELARLDALEAAAKHELALAEITHADLIGKQRQFNAARLYTDLVFLEQKRALALRDPERKASALESIEQERLATVAKYAEQGAEISRAEDLQSLESRKRYVQQRADIDMLQVQGDRAAALARVAELDTAAQTERELGMITQAEYLARLDTFNQQRMAIELAFLEQKRALALLDPAQNPVELERIEMEKQEILRRYAAQGMDIQRQMAIESQSIWRSLTSTIEGLWDKGINALMNGTLTWRNAFRAIGTEMVGWFATNVVGAMVKEWLIGETKKLLIKMGFLGKEKVAQKIASGEVIGVKAAETTAVAGANAVQAGTGAAASQASIPFAGPMLALAAMAAVFAAVSALGNRKSAMKGYDIPRGLNPVTQLHEEEMVLPSHLANAVRRMAAGANGTEAESGANNTFHFNVSAMDSRDVKRFFNDNGPALADALRKQVKQFTPLR